MSLQSHLSSTGVDVPHSLYTTTRDNIVKSLAGEIKALGDIRTTCTGTAIIQSTEDCRTVTQSVRTAELGDKFSQFYCGQCLQTHPRQHLFMLLPWTIHVSFQIKYDDDDLDDFSAESGISRRDLSRSYILAAIESRVRLYVSR